MTSSGAAARRKGADFERGIVLRFREAMPDAEVRSADRGNHRRGSAEPAPGSISG